MSRREILAEEYAGERPYSIIKVESYKAFLAGYSAAMKDAEVLVRALDEITSFSCSCAYWREDCPQCLAGKALAEWRKEGE